MTTEVSKNINQLVFQSKTGYKLSKNTYSFVSVIFMNIIYKVMAQYRKFLCIYRNIAVYSKNFHHYSFL
jgi:hypothetical protein